MRAAMMAAAIIAVITASGASGQSLEFNVGAGLGTVGGATANRLERSMDAAAGVTWAPGDRGGPPTGFVRGRVPQRLRAYTSTSNPTTRSSDERVGSPGVPPVTAAVLRLPTS